MPLKADGTFDFEDVDHYPVLETVDPDDPNSDLSLFIKQVKSEGLMRDFSIIPVPDVPLISGDHRDTTNDSGPRCISTSYNLWTLYTPQTVPAFIPAVAKFSIPMDGFDEPLYFPVEQLFCDESPEKSVTVVPVLSGRIYSKERIQDLGDPGTFVDFSAAYNQDVMSGPLENVRTQQEYDAWLLQQYMERGNLAIFEMHDQLKIKPGADNALFIGMIMKFKVADSTS